MIKRRPIEVFSISFLDALSCGFGAILLLFILSIGSGPHGLDGEVDASTLEAMREQLASLEADIAEKSTRLEAATNREETSRERRRIESLVQELESKLADLQQEYESRRANLSRAEQEAAEAQRLLKNFPHEDLPPIGLPAEATHVAFVIDTSGSMRNQLTQQLHSGVIEQIRELLDSLPEVSRIQFLDTSGNYMLGGRRGFWLPDTPGLRQQALQQMRRYPVMSVSDPEPGLRRSIRDLKPQLNNEDRMSLYVIGDDFRGSTQSLLLKLDRLNPRDPRTGKRPVSISAVGFPTLVNPFQLGAAQGNARFANIMREIAEAHDGVLILKPGI
jgi:multidrug efflux pump subunit AcrA (membrane-fusion protein)